MLWPRSQEVEFGENSEFFIFQPQQFGDRYKVMKNRDWGGAPAANDVHFLFKKEIFGATWSPITSCTGVTRKLRFGKSPRPSPQNDLWIAVGTSGVWGEAPAANDFGAFIV